MDEEGWTRRDGRGGGETTTTINITGGDDNGGNDGDNDNKDDNNVFLLPTFNLLVQLILLSSEQVQNHGLSQLCVPS